MPHIENCRTFLDVGCAEGYFVMKAANLTKFSLGVDIKEDRLAHAQNIIGFQPNSGFAYWEVNPNTVDNIPEFDVISLQTVIHHMYGAYGFNDSKLILQKLASKANVLIYEPPGNRYIGIEKIHAEVINTKTGDVYKIPFTEDRHNKGLRVRLKIGGNLPPGKYKLKVETDKFGSSNYFNFKIGKSGKIVGSRPHVKLCKEKVEIVERDEFSASDMTNFYEGQIINILGNEVEILERTITDYTGGDRKDPFFVIDVSSVNETLSY